MQCCTDIAHVSVHSNEKECRSSERVVRWRRQLDRLVVASITHARMSSRKEKKRKKRKKRKKEGKRKKGGFLFPYDFDRMSAFLLL